MKPSNLLWSVRSVNLKELKPFGKNPRYLSNHDAKEIEKSIDRFGLCEPIIANLDNTIIGGHQRVKILKKKRVKEAQVFYPNRELSEKEVEELNIRLNKNSGDFDFEILANEWEPCDLLEWGFKEEDLLGKFEEEIPEDKDKKPKKKEKLCPNCGHNLNGN